MIAKIRKMADRMTKVTLSASKMRMCLSATAHMANVKEKHAKI